MTTTLTKAQARRWLDDHGHAAIALPRKGMAVLNAPPIYMERAGIDATWTVTAMGSGVFTLDAPPSFLARIVAGKDRA